MDRPEADPQAVRQALCKSIDDGRGDVGDAGSLTFGID
jgi:hypothetical protein